MRIENRVRRGGQVGIALVLLLSASGAGAAVDCRGKWHLGLARPSPEKELWLSPGSWCRSNTLPQALDVEVRRTDAGGVSMIGTPLAPSDVLMGAGKCTFAFSGSASHVPPNHELTIEVAVAGAGVQGTAHCAEKTPAPNGSTGKAVDVAVTGNVVGEVAAAPVDARDLVASVVRACQRRDADALWKLSTPRLQAESEERAAQVRAAVPPADLRRLYGVRGKPETFTGLAFLRYAVKSDRPAENPCAGVADWKLEETTESPDPDRRLVAIRQANGQVFGLTFVPDDRGWRLDQISKAVAPGH